VIVDLFRRRRKLPAERRPPLDRHERVTAWAPVDGGGTVVVTDRGLFLPGRKTRLGWHEIHKATWSGRELTVVPAGVVQRRDGYDVVEDRPALSYVLPEAGDVPDQVRTRVTRSVGYSTHYPTPGVRVVARRVPGVDGVSWAVRYDPGVDSADPAVLAATADLVAVAQSSI
jgi:hypothetical protein